MKKSKYKSLIASLRLENEVMIDLFRNWTNLPRNNNPLLRIMQIKTLWGHHNKED